MGWFSSWTHARRAHARSHDRAARACTGETGAAALVARESETSCANSAERNQTSTTTTTTTTTRALQQCHEQHVLRPWYRDRAVESARSIDAVIVGAGPAGLATAACLKRRGLSFELLERADQVGSSWRNHYARLHLHTARNHSALPFTPFPKHLPTYPSRQDVVDYLESYAREHGLEPRFDTDVQRVARDGERWIVLATNGAWRAKHVVLATGYNRVPRVPVWPDRELFRGRVLHSRDYRTGKDFTKQRVLVVGAGNSGAEIALDLCEQGAAVSLCIRGPINVIPRDLLGIPAQAIGIATGWQPDAITDFIMRMASRLVFGDLSKWGIERKKKGPLRQILDEQSIPLIDVGTIRRIKKGEIAVVPGIERFTERGVLCTDGRAHKLDVVVLATGYTTGLATILAGLDDVLDAKGYPRAAPPEPSSPGLHFVGFANVPTGLLRQIAIQARAVADALGPPQLVVR